MNRFLRSVGVAGRFLYEFVDEMGKVVHSVTGEDFFMTPKGMRKIGRKMEMGDEQYYNTLRQMRRKGYLEKEGNKYLITPKGYKEINLIKIENDDWSNCSWDGKWKIVIFDIPEKKRAERDAFRSFLMRKGFVKLQNSVFVSPFADFDAINTIRHEYGIAKHVNFLVSESPNPDDDSLLRKKFGLP